MQRTFENCTLIKKCVSIGIGEPEQYENKCVGYARGENDDEPCEQCKNCKLNTSYEGEYLNVDKNKWINIEEYTLYCPDIHATIEITEETCSNCKQRTRFIGNKQYLNDKYCPSCGLKLKEK